MLLLCCSCQVQFEVPDDVGLEIGVGLDVAAGVVSVQAKSEHSLEQKIQERATKCVIA